MSARHHKIAIGLLAALASHAGFAAEPDSGKALLEQGKYWQARGNGARAAEAWGRLLLIDPKQPDALYNLGLLELEAKRTTNAQGYLKQLQELGTAPIYAAQLEQEIMLRGGTKPKELESARLLAESGELDKAVVAYRALFGGATPQGKLALEYYGYLGYTNAGWEESRQGLERLQREMPNDPQIALVLAKHLIRNERTRPQGIRRLAELSKRPDIGGGAEESWRMALSWYTNPTAAEAPLFDAYLKAHPDDTEIRELSKKRSSAPRAAQVQTATKARVGGGKGSAAQAAVPWQQDPALATGFRQLEAGDIVAAEAAFRQRLTAKADDADALGGLGLVRMRQERPDDALDFFTRAARQGGTRSPWKPMVTTAQYWSFVANGEKLRASGDLPEAQQTLEQAIKLDTGDTTAETALARVQAENGQFDAAEKTYRRLLARDKSNFFALQGLVNVLAQTDRLPEAIGIVETLTPEQQEKIGSVGRLRATQARAAAKAASARGDDATARQLLESGLRYEPEEPWLRLDLARLYLKTGATNEARGLVDGLLLTSPDLPGALLTSALLSSELQDWPAALGALERIAPQDRTKEIVELQRNAWINAQAARATQLATSGQKGKALEILSALEPELGQNTGLLGTVASAYVDAGEPARALNMLRKALSRTTRPDNALLLQYTGILLKSNQDAEAAGILRDLQGQQLSVSERTSFEALRKLYTVRQAESLRQRGKLADAYDVLSPMITLYPDDPLVLGALARMYASAGDGAKSLGIYKQLLARDPDNTDLLIAASQAAVQAKDNVYADSALNTALSLQPDSSKVLSSAARIYRSQGKSGKAADYLKLAIAAQNKERAGAGVTQLAAAAPLTLDSPVEDDNPFATLPGQTRSRPPVVHAQGAAVAALALPVAPPAAQTMTVLPGGTSDVAVPYAGGIASSPGAYASAKALPAAPPRAAARPLQPFAPQALPRGPATLASPIAYAELPGSGSTPAMPVAESAVAPQARQAARADMAAQSAAVPNYASPATATASVAPAPVSPGRPPVLPAPAAVVPAPPAAPRTDTLPAAVDSLPAYVAAPTPVPSQFRNAPEPTVLAQAGQTATVDAPKTLEQELDEIQAARSPIVTVGTNVRQRNGEAGLGRLVSVETPVTVNFPVGEGDARAFVQATPVTLRSGDPGTGDAASRFGGGPVAAAAQTAGTAGTAGNQNASGVGVAVGYQSHGMKVDIGSTPFGFRYQNVVGGIRFSDTIAGAESPRYSYGVDVSRRAVTDSVLSFAGARDNRTGESWGGVTSTGARLSGSADYDTYGFYANAGYHSINGRNVASNTRVSGSAGSYMHLIREANRQLTAGLNLTAMSYDKNLSGYTYGQGGYFSPQSFLSVGVPVTWSSRDGRLSYTVRGSVGVQHIKQDASPYYADGARQADAQAAAAAGNGTATYAGQSKTGLGYGLYLAAEYQMTPNAFLGGQLGMDNSRDYRQFAGGLYLRYALEAQQGQMAFPIIPEGSSYTSN